MAADDKFDSFFELDKHDSFYFLNWCGQHDISVKRLFVQISSEKTRDQTAENLQKLVEKYLRKFGSTVLAVSLKFTFNCSSRWSYFIKTVFKHCPNLIMFSLNAEMLDLQTWQAEKIFKEVTKCPSLRDWVFLGFSPFSRRADSTLFRSFCSLLKTMLGEDNVRQLFLSRTQRTLQPCQHTLGTLLAMEEKKQLRITRIYERGASPWSHDLCFGRELNVYIYFI